MKCKTRRIALLGVERDSQRHFAFVSKLDGVADEIHEDLAKPGGVATNDFWNIRGNLAKKLETLFISPQGQRLQGCFHAVNQAEITQFEFHFSGFDLGEIENVVDDREERVRGEFHGFQIFPLFA